MRRRRGSVWKRRERRGPDGNEIGKAGTGCERQRKRDGMSVWKRVEVEGSEGKG